MKRIQFSELLHVNAYSELTSRFAKHFIFVTTEKRQCVEIQESFTDKGTN